MSLAARAYPALNPGLTPSLIRHYLVGRPQDQKQSFVPLMAGNLTKQLDFSKKEGAGAAAVAEGAEEGKKDASWSDFKSAA